MKKASFIFLFPVMTLFLLSLNAQAKDFKGVVTYKITIQGDDIPPEMMAFMPKVMTATIKGNMLRNEFSITTPMGAMNQIQIMNGDEKVVYHLMDMMGQKFYYKMTEQDINENMENEPKPDIQYVNETKTIAGYECKKAIITIDQDGKKNSFVIYYSPELGSASTNFDNAMFNGIDGLLMEFEANENGMIMKFEAIEVKKENVKDELFQVPAEYNETTPEELQRSFGG